MMKLWKVLTVLGAFTVPVACQSAMDSAPDPWAMEESAIIELPDGGRLDPPGEHAWAPSGMAVRVHTLEESEATRLEWQQVGYEGSRWRIPIGIHFWSDAKLTVVNPDRFQQRSSFYGLGRPFFEEYVHLFECGGEAEDATYLAEDALVRCRGRDGIEVSFLRGDGYFGPPEDHRLREWKEGLDEAADQSGNLTPLGQEHDISLWVWPADTQQPIHVSREPVLGKTHPGGAEFYYWSGPSFVVPPEDCLYSDEVDRERRCLSVARSW